MIKKFKESTPIISEKACIFEDTSIIGDVLIEEDCNIWFGARLRGDMNKIVIKKGTNIQENAVVHVDDDYETIIGEGVTVGHGAIVHGCTISDNVLIGMGSIILNGAKIGKNSIVGAGALVTQNKEFEEGVLILGNPAKAVRKLKQEEIDSIKESAKHYISLSKEYA
ncbi:gamma carbonic anhydrase family protein [Clostridium baratii]|uniref:gamma carbonic anhydrase family protein n=1 Tax=Clostridium baratii TaxID=1561 RepID=UPI0005F2D698|nr:gamma carbonic anhydrase family protein [Clostridium baratii]KJU72771.1 transferase [Clostridium baratii]